MQSKSECEENQDSKKIRRPLNVEVLKSCENDYHDIILLVSFRQFALHCFALWKIWKNNKFVTRASGVTYYREYTSFPSFIK